MELAILGAAIFLLTIVIVELLAYAYRHLRSTKRAKVRKRLRRYAYAEDGTAGAEILKKRIYSDIPWLNRLLHMIPPVKALDRLVVQANAKYPMGFYLLLSAFLGFAGFYVTHFLTMKVHFAALAAFIGLILPYASLNRDKAKRIEKFKKQLPDALGMIARAMKAGHAFTGGMSMLSEEFDDPIGPEFAETLDEINYGVSVADALKTLAGRIDCDELKYFIVGVILQRETGGNLAELMDILANLIRERFKFEGKVQTLTAEGRFSAVVLIILPIALGIFLFIRNPNFLNPLLTEPAGKLMIVLAAAGMVVGTFVIRRMVKIKI